MNKTYNLVHFNEQFQEKIVSAKENLWETAGNKCLTEIEKIHY